MSEIVFWDTAAFVALGNRDDDLHTEAVAVNQDLASQRAFVLTTDAVLTEVANTFSRAAWHPIAQQLIESLRASVALELAEVIHVDVELWQRGWYLFCTRPDKDWSLSRSKFRVLNQL